MADVLSPAFALYRMLANAFGTPLSDKEEAMVKSKPMSTRWHFITAPRFCRFQNAGAC